MTAIVILGAKVLATGPSAALLRRTSHGAALYKAGHGTRIIPCGGLGPHSPSEAEAMRDLLIQDGIPEPAIHPETSSDTTYENLRNAQVILNRLDEEEAIIVTDRYHARRAALVARALGLVARCDCPDLPRGPRSLHLRRLRHEALALPAYALRLPIWIRRDRRDQRWRQNVD